MLKKLQKNCLTKAYFCITNIAEKYLFSLLLLFMRIWMAKIFWYSGLTKIDNWQSTIFLFKYEYQVPIIPAEIAALLATAMELSAPILLAIGLMSRLSALPMLVMTAVIQFTYLDLVDHTYWAILLGTIILYGPGKISLDHFIRLKLQKVSKFKSYTQNK